MKKMICILLSAMLIFSTAPAFADDLDETLLWDIVYTADDGNRIFSPEGDTVYSSAHIYNGAGGENVYMMTCSFDKNGTISDMNVKTHTLTEGYNILNNEGITPSTGSIKTLVLDKNLSLVPVEKRSNFSNEISPLEITSFSLSLDGRTYKSVINGKTNEIFVNVPYFTIGEGESTLARPDMNNALENVTVSGGTYEKIDTNGDFEKGIKYSVTDENGNSRIYTAYVIYTLRQYSSDFEDSVISGIVSGDKGSSNLKTTGSSGAVSVIDNSGKWLNVKKTSTDNTLAFSATEGCSAEMATDFFMEFDFKIDSISSSGNAMYWYMGEMHQIIPVKTTGGYTLKYRHGITGAVKEIPGIGEFEIGKTYNLSYSFSQSDMKGQLYIDRKYVGTLENIHGKVTSQKLSPIISFTAFKNALVDASFDNVDVTYTEIQPTDKKKLHIIGDSIVQTYLPNDKRQEGWGSFMPDAFTDEIFVKNHAFSGQASGMALYSGEPNRHDMAPIWPLLKYNIYEGDYVMIALGWNEKNNPNNPYNCTSPEEFKEYLEIMVNDTISKGATPILVTPTYSAANGSFYNPNKPYGDVMKELAKENNKVICLDLMSKLEEEFGAMGGPLVFSKYHVADGTHFNLDGAAYLANAVCTLLKESDCDLKNYLLPANTPSAPKSPLFSVTDSTGKYTYDGYVDFEDKKIYVEEIADIYSNFDGDTNGYSKYYDVRSGDFIANLQNATYKTNIGGTVQSGNINLSIDTPAEIMIGADKYTVIHERYIRGIVGNFNSGRYFVPAADKDGGDSNFNIIRINEQQHVPETYGTRYGSAWLYATSISTVTSLQDKIYKPYYNISYAIDQGQNGKRDTCLRIEKKGKSSLTAPSLYLTEGSWGYNGKTTISYDVKFTEFDGNGSILDVEIPQNNPIVHLSMIKGSNSDNAKLTYTASSAEGFGGWGKTIAEIPKNEWTNIRIVIDKNSAQYPVNICVNGKVVLKTAYNYSNTSLPSSFGGNVVKFGTYSITNATYYLDNIELMCSQKSQ